jgi:hypothetical protein
MHIFVSGFVVNKAKEGDWYVSQVRTSEGIFNLGPEVSKEITITSSIEVLGKEVKEKLVPQIFEFLKNEKK